MSNTVNDFATTVANDERVQALRTSLSIAFAEIEPKFVIDQQTRKITLLSGSTKSAQVYADLLEWYIRKEYGELIDKLNAQADAEGGNPVNDSNGQEA